MPVASSGPRRGPHSSACDCSAKTIASQPLAGFHAAQAIREDRPIGEDSPGRHNTFGALTKDDADLDPETRAFLPQTYRLKAVADYDTDTEISAGRAMAALEAARRFVTYARSALLEG